VYRLRWYPDISHTVRCQYPVEWWDPAFALTLGREPPNPRAGDYASIFRLQARQTDGFVTYSEGLNDDVNNTINYGTLADDVVAAVSREPVDLIETVAERIAAVVLGHGAHSVRVELHKPSAPISVPFDDVSVVIERTRP
jgi:hypothetical protein